MDKCEEKIMERFIQGIESNTKMYGSLLKEMASINNRVEQLVQANTAISEHFQNGFRKELIDIFVEVTRQSSIETRSTLKQSVNSLYWRFAGTIILIVGLLSLIIKLLGGKI